ncbi:hypothetical protein GNE73_28000 [Klebsiella pneumoniae]|uniref:Uncharacterized protein n=1 Tax=Klebsiella pneumoniae TaxID=573 RepID=A0A6A8ZA81_KLEPN|nr:hypothetical protein [Klebsiella pneumoniae]MTZ53150.1 hypothetical protein [Klebsiella pneumoniae]RLO53461.1 hypothetical protein CPT39_29220 [Klebsiella pneumoniae]
MFAGKKSAQIREILISESAWEEMTCLFAPSLTEGKPIVLRHCYIHPNENAIHHFERAKKKYSTDWLLGEDERLFLKIDFDKTDKIVVEYNLEKIGMEQR